MFNYRNEAAFSKAFVQHLRKYGWFVQRIESGSTGRGVPDIYCISPQGNAFWFELKRVHMNAAGHKVLSIPWRPGQQTWLHGVHKYNQRVFTLACFNDMILVIKHDKIHKDDLITPISIVERWWYWKDAIK